MSPRKVGVQAPLTDEILQSKPLTAEVSLEPGYFPPARTRDSAKACLRLSFATGVSITAAVIVRFADLQQLLISGRRYVVNAKRYRDGTFCVTHIGTGTDGMIFPLRPC